MIHDPICPYQPRHEWKHREDPDRCGQPDCTVWIHVLPEIPCQCDLIAKVRADQTNHCIRQMRSELKLFAGSTKVVRDRLTAAMRRKAP